MLATLLAAALLASPRTAAPRSLCGRDEPVTYTCPVRSRVLSVCGRGGQAVYRFGRPGRVEVEAGRPTFAERGFAGGGETQVAFHAGDVSYTVHQSTVRTRFGPDGRHDPKFSDGVLVRRGALKLADIGCTGPTEGDLTDGGRGAPAGTFVEP